MPPTTTTLIYLFSVYDIIWHLWPSTWHYDITIYDPVHDIMTYSVSYGQPSHRSKPKLVSGTDPNPIVGSCLKIYKTEFYGLQERLVTQSFLLMLLTSNKSDCEDYWIIPGYKTIFEAVRLDGATIYHFPPSL